MIDWAQLLEERLAKGYADQVAHYDGALLALNRQPSWTQSDAQDESWVFELQRALNEVGAIDAAIANDKLAWQKIGRPPGKSLRPILDTLERRIRTLAEIVDRRVAALKEKRQQMMPELDGFIRQRRMLKAYDQYGRVAESAGKNSVPEI